MENKTKRLHIYLTVYRLGEMWRALWPINYLEISDDGDVSARVGLIVTLSKSSTSYEMPPSSYCPASSKSLHGAIQ